MNLKIGNKLIAHSIIKQANLNLEGKAVIRNAVRAVISKDNQLLMIYSSVNGDYKFPGGGIENGETHFQALQREIKEECGAEVEYIGDKLAVLTEYRHAIDDGFDIFKMSSHYYLCSIHNELSTQTLDFYEKDLGFIPVWISIKDAIDKNEQILKKKEPPRWTERETYFLKELL